MFNAIPGGITPSQSSPSHKHAIVLHSWSHIPSPNLIDTKGVNHFWPNYDRILIEFCLLIPNIQPKVLNWVVKGVRTWLRRAFEVPLLDRAHLYFKCYSGLVWITLVFCKLVPTDSEYMIKKELAAYSRLESLEYPEVLIKKLILVDLVNTLPTHNLLDIFVPELSFQLDLFCKFCNPFHLSRNRTCRLFWF